MTEETNGIRPAPEGWVLQRSLETFGGHAGPFYFRQDRGGVGFFAEPRHANVEGIAHGGALLTLADIALFDMTKRVDPRFYGVTVTLNAEFVGAGPIGAFITASGEVTRAGKSLVFCRGAVEAAGATIMTFSGVLKRLR